MFSVPVACCAAMHAAHSLPSQELIAITVWSLLPLRSRCRPYRMFSADTLFLVLLSPAQSLSLCTLSFLGAVCHSNMIPMSGHPVTYLVTRLSLCQSLILGLGAQSHCVLYGPACPPPSCSAWPLCFCTDSSCLRPAHHVLVPFHFGCREPASTPRSILVYFNHQRFRSLSDGWRDHSLRMLQILCFDDSLTVSFVQDLRDPGVLPQDFPVQHDQRLGKLTGRSHHCVLRLEVCP